MALYMLTKLVIELHPGEEGVAKYLEQLNYKVLRPSKHFLIAKR